MKSVSVGEWVWSVLVSAAGLLTIWLTWSIQPVTLRSDMDALSKELTTIRASVEQLRLDVEQMRFELEGMKMKDDGVRLELGDGKLEAKKAH